jgi:hypothetical protein
MGGSVWLGETMTPIPSDFCGQLSTSDGEIWLTRTDGEFSPERLKYRIRFEDGTSDDLRKFFSAYINYDKTVCVTGTANDYDHTLWPTAAKVVT